jgi:hypothetical protein
MKHLVVINKITDPNTHKAVVIEEPPTILTGRGMYFMAHQKLGFGNTTTYFYIQVNGCPLAAINTPEIVEE